MSEYSKQYCETHNIKHSNGDFDILEQWNMLKPGYCVNLVCEGYGFNAICKSEDGEECLLHFPDGFYKDDTPNHNDLGVYEGTHWLNYFKLDLL